ncbi:MAG: hypothetical protein ACYSSN_07620, partial [Planctomycetota bacterium]
MINDKDILEQELHKRRKAYEQAKWRGLKSLRRESIDDALYWLCTAGRIGWAYHFGTWIDPQLEDALKKIATAFCIPTSAKDSRSDHEIKRVVHLASFVQDGGGHTEVIKKWIQLLSGLGD